MSPASAAGFHPSEWIALISIIVAGVTVLASYFFFWRLQKDRQRYETWSHLRNQQMQVYTEFRYLALRLMDCSKNAQRPEEDLLRRFTQSYGELQLICGASASKAVDGVYRLVMDAVRGNAPERLEDIFANAMKDLKEQIREAMATTKPA